MLKEQGGEVVPPFAFSVAITQSSALCARGEAGEQGGGCSSFKQSWKEGYCAVFSLPKLQTLIDNMKGPAWPLKL